jgi:Protein of unknown function (DUF3048) N-terminal domain/Protein of unknown function (DUF3048) C-terminal domain
MRRLLRPQVWLRLEIAVVVAVVAIVTIVLVVRGMGSQPGAPVAPGLATPTTSGTGPTVLAVKIDNVAAARPATGLGLADIVFVEPVEGGLTRLAAIYAGQEPAVVGPVRSARQTDIELLGQYGTPVFAYSGAAPHLLPRLHAAALVNASPAEAGAAYYRDPARAAPHNLYLRPEGLPGGALPPAEPVAQVGPAPATGTPSTSHQVAYPSARYAFTWSPQARRWLVSLDRSPLVSTETGQLTATTVVEQRVVVSTTETTEDTPGTVSPVARTVGSGTATVLRDGQRFEATWSRAAPNQPTRFIDASGAPLPFVAGQVWILLVAA